MLTEPYSPWQNAAELAIRELKKGAGCKAAHAKSPRKLCRTMCLKWNPMYGPIQCCTTQSLIPKYLKQSCPARWPIYHPLLNSDGMIGSSSLTHLGGTQSHKNCLVDGLAQQTISALQCQVLKPKSDKVRQTDCRTEIWESVLNHICISLWHSERF